MSSASSRQISPIIEKEEFDALYRKSAPWLLGYLRWCHQASSVEAEDAVHGAFVALWESRTVVRSPHGWLMTVAVRNLAADRAAASGTDTLDGDPCEPERERVEDPPALSVRSQLVLEAIAGLSPRRKQIVELTLAGLSAREIADELGISTSTVRSHLCQSSDLIRRALARSGELA